MVVGNRGRINENPGDGMGFAREKWEFLTSILNGRILYFHTLWTGVGILTVSQGKGGRMILTPLHSHPDPNGVSTVSEHLPLTPKQQKIYNFIRKHIETKGYPP